MNKLFDKNFVLNGWLSIPNSFTAEAMSSMGWDSVTIDLQHGQNDYSTSISMVQAISNSNVVPFARFSYITLCFTRFCGDLLSNCFKVNSA